MTTLKLGIKAWAEEDRPREKLLSYGRKHISTAEIIALLLGSGTRNRSALDIAQELMAACEHNIQKLAKMSVKELTSFKGIGPAKAANLIAAIELGLRIQSTPIKKEKSIQCSSDAYNLVKASLVGLDHEQFWIIILNNSLQVQQIEKISVGGINSVLVDVRIVFKKAIEKLATAVILCHNHPSGKLFPSQADKDLTNKMVEAGKYLDIKIADHLIVTASGFYSFNDEGLL